MWARGWCATHYRRWQRYGTTERTSWGKITLCSVEDCARRAKKRGWCEAHYWRWRTSGDVQSDIPLLRTNRVEVNGEMWCNGCSTWKSVADWARRQCGDCARGQYAAWYAANPDYFQEWRRANPDRVRATGMMRRAAKMQVPRERIDPSEVFERDRYECRLCDEPLVMDAYWLDPLAPTVDHIVPLSKGGHHTYENVQAAHRRCNTVKGDRIA